MHEAIKEAKGRGCKVVIFDNDETLYKGQPAKSIGYGFLIRELDSFHAYNVLTGLQNILKIKANGLTNQKSEKHTKNLEILFNCLGDMKTADMNSAYEFARSHIIKNEVDGLRNFVNESKTIGPRVIATLGTDITADISREEYGFEAQVSNPVIYLLDDKEVYSEPMVYLKNEKLEGKLDFGRRNPMISGCKIPLRTPQDKKHYSELLLEKLGFSLKDAFVIGSDELDIPLMRASGFSVTSPLANEKAITIADGYLEDYVSRFRLRKQ